MSSDNLWKHALLNLPADKLKPVIDESIKILRELAKEGKFRSEMKRPIPEPFWYEYEVFILAITLVEALERLEEVCEFLQEFPCPETYEKRRITQDKWIEYHYANYISNVVGLYDLALILTNSVFGLGIPDRECKDSTILRNRWVTGTPVKVALDALNARVRSYREPRNLHLHRGQLPVLGQIDELKVFSFLQRAGKPLEDPKLINSAYASVVKGIVTELRQEIGHIQSEILSLFDTLLKIYERRTLLENQAKG